MHAPSAIIILATLLGFSAGQSLIPACVQSCIDSAKSGGCKATDLGCLCKANDGNFLPSLIGCMQANCDTALDNAALLEPLQWACQIEGEPLPAAAVSSAEAQQTASVTATDPATATSIVELTTIYGTTTLAGGSTVTLAYPGTIEAGTTVYGFGSIVTTTAAPSTSTVLTSSVVTTTVGSVQTLTTTDSAGSTVTELLTIVPIGGFLSTLTTTNSAGSTIISTETISTSPSSSSSQSTFSTTVLAEATTSTPSAPSTTATPAAAQTNPNNPDSTDSAPFQMQGENGSPGSRDAIGKSLALSIGMLAFAALL